MSEAIHDEHVTEEMIRNLRAGTFKKVMIGIAACGGSLLLGLSLLVWTWKHGTDPEVLREALRRMPPLSVTVKLDPESRVTLAEGGTVRLANPVMSTSAGREDHDPAIKTSVSVFKNVEHGSGHIMTGWDFPSGSATKPTDEFCYFDGGVTGGRTIWEDVGKNGVMSKAPAGVTDQRERFAKCVWFKEGAV